MCSFALLPLSWQTKKAFILKEAAVPDVGCLTHQHYTSTYLKHNTFSLVALLYDTLFHFVYINIMEINEE